MSEKNKEKQKLSGFHLSLIMIFFIFVSLFCFSNLKSNAAFCNPFTTNRETREGFYRIGKMINPRSFFSAIPISDNKIFIAGGYTRKYLNSSIMSETEVFDCKTGKSTAGPKLKVSCQKPLLFLLKDGRVLIKEDGKDELYIEIYNPKTNTIKTLKEYSEKELGEGNCLFDQFLYISDQEIALIKSNTTDKFIVFNTKTNNFELIKKEMFFRPDYRDIRYIMTIGNYSYFYRSNRIIKVENDLFYKYIKNQISKETIASTIDSNSYYNENLKRIYSNWAPNFFYLEKENKFEILTKNHLVYFNIKDNTFENKECKNFTYQVNGFNTAFKLKNNNILIQLPYAIQELNTKTLYVETKNYNVPAFRATMLRVGNGDIVYLGGITQIMYDSADKIYLWKEGP